MCVCVSGCVCVGMCVCVCVCVCVMQREREREREKHHSPHRLSSQIVWMCSSAVDAWSVYDRGSVECPRGPGN